MTPQSFPKVACSETHQRGGQNSQISNFTSGSQKAGQQTMKQGLSRESSVPADNHRAIVERPQRLSQRHGQRRVYE